MFIDFDIIWTAVAAVNTWLEDINKFRQERKLPVLTENENAACLAEQIAEQFKG